MFSTRRYLNFKKPSDSPPSKRSKVIPETFYFQSLFFLPRWLEKKGGREKKRKKKKKKQNLPEFFVRFSSLPPLPLLSSYCRSNEGAHCFSDRPEAALKPIYRWPGNYLGWEATGCEETTEIRSMVNEQTRVVCYNGKRRRERGREKRYYRSWPLYRASLSLFLSLAYSAIPPPPLSFSLFFPRLTHKISMPIGVSIKSACNGIFVSRTRRTFSPLKFACQCYTRFRFGENDW